MQNFKRGFKLKFIVCGVACIVCSIRKSSSTPLYSIAPTTALVIWSERERTLPMETPMVSDVHRSGRSRRPRCPTVYQCIARLCMSSVTLNLDYMCVCFEILCSSQIALNSNWQVNGKFACERFVFWIIWSTLQTLCWLTENFWSPPNSPRLRLCFKLLSQFSTVFTTLLSKNCLHLLFISWNW